MVEIQQCHARLAVRSWPSCGDDAMAPALCTRMRFGCNKHAILRHPSAQRFRRTHRAFSPTSFRVEPERGKSLQGHNARSTARNTSASNARNRSSSSKHGFLALVLLCASFFDLSKDFGACNHYSGPIDVELTRRVLLRLRLGWTELAKEQLRERGS